MIEIKIVVKCRKRLNDSDRDFIKKFIDRYFKESKEIQEIYIEEKVVV